MNDLIKLANKFQYKLDKTNPVVVTARRLQLKQAMRKYINKSAGLREDIDELVGEMKNLGYRDEEIIAMVEDALTPNRAFTPEMFPEEIRQPKPPADLYRHIGMEPPEGLDGECHQ